MFTSTAEVFRTRQAVRDLAEVVGLHRKAMQRLGTSGADRDVISRITAGGCRIDIDQHRDAYSSILFAAAMPDEDFPAFTGATALLLADRLQQGGGTDDLFWNWDAFHDHYRLADPPARAALMNGFRLADQLGMTRLALSPADRDCLTFEKADVVASLGADGQHDLAEAVQSDVSPDRAGVLWQTTYSSRTGWQVIQGFRYLYERAGSMAPPHPDTVPLIPASLHR